MEDKERFDLILMRFKQIDRRMDSLDKILNTLLFKALTNEFMIASAESYTDEKKAIAETEAGKAMGRMKAIIDAHIADKDIPQYKKYLPEIP